MARYKGTGDATNAANFACVADDHDKNGPRFTDFSAAHEDPD